MQAELSLLRFEAIAASTLSTLDWSGEVVVEFETKNKQDGTIRTRLFQGDISRFRQTLKRILRNVLPLGQIIM